MVSYVSAGAILSGLDPTFVALVGTLFGGVGLKVAESWLNKSRVKVDDAKNLRDELRAEITSLRAENHELEDDVDKWREEYYDLRDTVSALKALIKIHRLDEPEE